jgi:hypothetical protein
MTAAPTVTKCVRMETTFHIANPTYDLVFKYLLDDVDIARDFLSLLLDVEILSIAPCVVESVTEVRGPDDIKAYRMRLRHEADQKAQTKQAAKLGEPALEMPFVMPLLGMIRLDYSITYLDAKGESKAVLVEMQKSRYRDEIDRYRLYLANHMSRLHMSPGETKGRMMPLVACYFLNHNLDHITKPVFHVMPYGEEVGSGEEVDLSEERFITMLHHESYIVQIQRLPDQTKTRLDRVLRLLKQPMEAGFEVDCVVDVSEPLVGRMVARLTRAVSDEELRRKLDLQAQVENRFTELIDQALNMEVALEEKDQVIAEKDQALVEKDQVIEKALGELEAKDRALAEALAELARLRSSAG